MSDIPCNFEKRFYDYVIRHNLLSSERPTLLAVSGGVDSVVLTHLFARNHLPFAIAHCHFGLRPEAVEEITFVEGLARAYKVPFYTTSFATEIYARKHKVSIQWAARILRYDWFSNLLKRHRLEEVATAHHTNDAIETLLRNLVKGTGIKGLHGMLPRQGEVIHPLLFADKKEVLAYAESYGLSWKEDISNKDTKYDRNFIRHKIIPELKVLNPGLETTFNTTVRRLQQVEQLFESEVKKLRRSLWRTELDCHYISIDKLLKIPWAGVVLEEWLAPFGFHFKQLQRWVTTPPHSGKKLYSPSHCLLADRGAWIVTPLERSKVSSMQEKIFPIEEGEKEVVIEIGEGKGSRSFLIKQKIFLKKDYLFSGDPYRVAFDLSSLKFPLTLTSWREGDAFYPMTSQRRYRKKLSDLFIDAKVSCHNKKNISILRSKEEIVWVVGYQIDDRFKVTKKTSKILEITCSPIF